MHAYVMYILSSREFKFFTFSACTHELLEGQGSDSIHCLFSILHMR